MRKKKAQAQGAESNNTAGAHDAICLGIGVEGGTTVSWREGQSEAARNDGGAKSSWCLASTCHICGATCASMYHSGQ